MSRHPWDEDTVPLAPVVRSHRRPPDPWRVRLAGWRGRVGPVGAGGAVGAGVAVLLLGLLAPAPVTAGTYVSPADMRAVCSRAAGWPGQTETEALERCVRAFTEPTATPTPAPSGTPSPSPSPSPTGSPSPTPSPSTTTPVPSPSSSPAPTPTGSPTPSPTGTPTPGLDCLRQQFRCGWPTEHNTGPDAFAPLTAYPGPYPFRMRADTTYENLVIDGCVLVEGSNSVLRNSIVRGDCRYVMVDLEDHLVSGVVFDRVEFDLTSMVDRFNIRAISGHGFTIRASHVHGGADPVHYGGDITIVDSLMEVPLFPGCGSLPAPCTTDPHMDTLHSSPGHPDPARRRVWIEHNTLLNANTSTSVIINGPDLLAYGSTYLQDDVHVVGNLLAGGGYSVYGEAHREDRAIGLSVPMAELRDNRFSQTFYSWPLGPGHPIHRGGYWGYTTDCLSVPGYSTNVIDETGQPLPADENPRAY